MFRLADHHLEAAQKIAVTNRKKKRCDECYDRGWIGLTEQNLLVLCTRCVDMEKAMDAWKEYVSGHEDLKEHFAELFEEKEVETEHTETEKHNIHDMKKAKPANMPNFTPGMKRTGRAKKI
ncbi:MAG: hypothetical protein CVU49_08255 [Candidatus Cloacimonetes bacterium HGW-Cloacimonetes-2]|jgi:hypothetical protein|nr:MAG: hypothetical protein CVU49_08255 [Candidatus Cloacimonetes bacterium HGW-Cloacimonetes-2]